MTRLEKIELAYSKGYTCDPETGKCFNKQGREITATDKRGYIKLWPKRGHNLMGHQYVWWWVHREVILDRELDHINGIKTDNRLLNLRLVSHQENTFNTKAKGCHWCVRDQIWIARIRVGGKTIYLYRGPDEQAAHQAYLDAKLIHHPLLTPQSPPTPPLDARHIRI